MILIPRWRALLLLLYYFLSALVVFPTKIVLASYGPSELNVRIRRLDCDCYHMHLLASFGVLNFGPWANKDKKPKNFQSPAHWSRMSAVVKIKISCEIKMNQVLTFKGNVLGFFVIYMCLGFSCTYVCLCHIMLSERVIWYLIKSKQVGYGFRVLNVLALKLLYKLTKHNFLHYKISNLNLSCSNIFIPF